MTVISCITVCSQELLDGVVQERNASHNQPRNAAIFHHPALGNFEIQHVSGKLYLLSFCVSFVSIFCLFYLKPYSYTLQLPVGVNDAELEERIIQHLAAAAAMGRSRHFSRREGHRGRSSAQARPNFLVFSAHPNAQDGAVSLSEGEQAESPASSIDTSSLLRIGREVSPRISVPNYSAHADTLSASGTSAFSAGHASPSNSG